MEMSVSSETTFFSMKLQPDVGVVGPKHMFHKGYEPTHMLDLVGPKV